MSMTRECQESERSFDNSRPLKGMPPCSKEISYQPNIGGSWLNNSPTTNSGMSTHTVEKPSQRKDGCLSVPGNVVIKIEPQVLANQQCDKIVTPNVFVASDTSRPEVGQSFGGNFDTQTHTNKNVLHNNLGHQFVGHNILTTSKNDPGTCAEERPCQHNTVYPQNIFTNSELVTHTIGSSSIQNNDSQSSLRKVHIITSVVTNNGDDQDLEKNEKKFVDIGIQTEEDIRCCNNELHGFQKEDRILQSKDKANTSSYLESIADEKCNDNVLFCEVIQSHTSQQKETSVGIPVGSTDAENVVQHQQVFMDVEIKQESSTCSEEETITGVIVDSDGTETFGQHEDAFLGFENRQDHIQYSIEQSSMNLPACSTDAERLDHFHDYAQSFAENPTLTWTRRKTHRPQKYDGGGCKGSCCCVDDQSPYLKNSMMIGPLREFECPDCGKVVSNKGSLVSHRKTHLSDKPFVCTECDKRFANRCFLITHVRSHACEKRHMCNECGRSFTTPKLLAEHKVIHTGEKPMQCKQCGYVCAMKKRLYQHMQTHRTDKNFECGDCHKKFTLKSSLKKHMRVHTGEKPFRCPECDRTFSWTDNLVKHRRIHTGEKPYQCDRCGNCYSQKTGLDSHMKTHIKEDLTKKL
ncbi:uncharacterized protein LOC102804237 [Saccoglossus kowalevskii]|uniref:Zinc finger protein 184-like n=1 Tax=Saccoglossus kowalevskii TaxID=10224 RepID=A0ABM0MXV3_SACKO|nr:PREDICTED: zinc finger protein 184-like [Saccoglossus kowalevskii]